MLHELLLEREGQVRICDKRLCSHFQPLTTKPIIHFYYVSMFSMFYNIPSVSMAMLSPGVRTSTIDRNGGNQASRMVSANEETKVFI
jgi:hypothetical protein